MGCHPERSEGAEAIRPRELFGDPTFRLLRFAQDDTRVTKVGRCSKIVPVFHVHRGASGRGGSDNGAIGRGGP